MTTGLNDHAELNSRRSREGGNLGLLCAGGMF